MSKRTESILKLKILIAAYLIQILFRMFFIAPAQAQWADHLVISAVQITEGEGKTNHDFIEIYNPTANDINLKGYRLVKRTKVGTSDTSIKSWTDEAIIKAHGWRLWASSDDEAYSLGIGADDATKQTIAPDNGVAIRLGAVDTGEIIDSMAWGEAENIFREGVVAKILSLISAESLVRKPGTPNEGNGEDTNNNINDFIVMVNFIPRNSQSSAAPAIENLITSIPTPAPSPNLSPAPSSGSIPNVSLFQSNLPVAEAGADKEAIIGESIDFDGSDSFDPAGKELFFIWNFGDKTSAKGINVSHIYNAIGDYGVILKADNGGNVSEDSLKVKIIAPEFSDKIILSEILPNPPGADKDGEWIELYNLGDKRVNIRGWILASSAKTSGKQFVFSGDNFIEAKSFLTIKRSESGLVLTNEGGGVSLAQTPDKVVSEVFYGSAKEGKSYAFIDNFWQWTDAATPDKENYQKISAAANSKIKEGAAVSVIITENAGNEGDSSEENISPDNSLGKLFLAENAVLSPSKNLDIENYLNKLISKKIDDTISKAKADEAPLEEKISSIAGNDAKGEAADTGEESACKDFCAENEKKIENGGKDIRNNPWFYGDIALSVLSLFLVWRYQEVRKKLKI